MEQPSFNENEIVQGRNIYKKFKQTIDREKCRGIEGMEQLWAEIQTVEQKAEKMKENGEEGSKPFYHLKHQLIQLRKQQYLLKDIAFPQIRLKRNYGSFYLNPSETQLNYRVFPCGTMGEENNPQSFPLHEKSTNLETEIQILLAEKKPFFNFLDSRHIYELCLLYFEIKDLAEQNFDSPLKNLLFTLDFYVEKANLSEQQRIILEGKKQRLRNKDICGILQERLGVSHQENYVSTVWNKVCRLIAAAANLHFDEWCCSNYEKAWKVCNSCGERLLADSRNFVRKAKSTDGLTNRCKKCDRAKRQQKILGKI